ncbi:polysaccharide pyruvyl transferase family protein [Pusillimonas sp. SM2304]|uniref:polysaccharide pyruvyl transferase family protein n=1 Tax=Pusillimonas sp. SM2304 TaxID=3073241 RepID=UPI002874E39D|nr:polysaccharide pyruvyl transferase family protein [Pusillimonas sp. SM2304]MDS1140063.1 polysaccharide pyruvyl transferase family protein [Pusillimonas sp. SM2304]
MKQTLFIGEYASRNVGDGIIKLAIETLCAKHGVAATFRDFYGGTPVAPESPADPFNAPTPQAGNPAPRTRPWPQRAWQALLRIALVNYSIALLFYATRYRRIAASYDVARYQQVIIGGGNLLMDNYLNFPLLILRIVQQCERHGVPVKLFSVGAGKRYSWLGRKIMARVLQSKAVSCVICRDANTHHLISDIAGESARHKIRCSADCGLYLTRNNFLAAPTNTVGLGVIAPVALQAVAPDHPMADARYALQWWDALIGALAEQVGADHIELISNGSGVDNDFAHAVWHALSPKYPGLSVCTSIASPGDLLQRIGSYKALAAYRMHAAVTAMALDVPVIGFEWDPKVLQLFTHCGKREACIPLAEFTQHPVRDVIAALLRQTPAQLAPIRQALDRDFRHATLA